MVLFNTIELALDFNLSVPQELLSKYYEVIKMKNIYISPSNQIGNVYAVGGTNEKEQCHKIAKACSDFLKANGFDTLCTYDDDMYKRVRESNDYNADLHIAIHTNATKKHNVTGGTQILLYSLDGERLKIGTEIFKKLSVLTPGNSAEKIVAKPDFYECRATNAICVYCECEFHDTAEGAKFIIENTKQIGEAIARGVLAYYGVKEVSNTAKLYTVQVGAYRDKTNAILQRNHLKKLGFTDCFIREV